MVRARVPNVAPPSILQTAIRCKQTATGHGTYSQGNVGDVSEEQAKIDKVTLHVVLKIQEFACRLF